MYFLDMIQHMQAKGIVPENVLHAEQNPNMVSMEMHSSKAGPQSLFCCFKGRNTDGHDYAEDAYVKGSRAFLCERELPLDVPQIVLKNLRENLGTLAAIFYGYPASSLRFWGVTGTNGKSSITYILRSILEAAGRKAGLVGTIMYDDGLEKHVAGRTTPEATDLQKLFSLMKQNGCTDCVMEISSHSVLERRLQECSFDGLIFSNLTPEHLDYHGDMESYFNAKAQIFSSYTSPNWRGAVNYDDSYGKRLWAMHPRECVPYAIEHSQHAAIQFLGATYSPENTMLRVLSPEEEEVVLMLPLLGEFNVSNVLGAMTLALSSGISWEAICSGVQNVPRIPGRVETYRTSRGVFCVIDYAHSPDALEKVLLSLRKCCSGSLRVLFGSGGNRFAGKRPLMGGAAARHADALVITMDNPRFEDPSAIAQQNYQGVLQENPAKPCEIIVDRREAIHFILDAAKPGDMVLLAGKGPENYLEICGKRHPYSDKAVFEEWCRSREVTFS